MTKRTRPTPPAPQDDAPDERTRIWQAVNAIPHGRVSTYGAIAKLAGLPGRARLVGRVLSQLPDGTRLPWHRVINASGRISVRVATDGGGEVLQAERLRAEGVLFATARMNTRVDLARFGWPEPERAGTLPGKAAVRAATPRGRPRRTAGAR